MIHDEIYKIHSLKLSKIISYLRWQECADQKHQEHEDTRR